MSKVSEKTKKVVQGTLRPLGLELIRWKPQTSPQAALARTLAHQRVDTVLDVGANEGQYARLLRELGFAGRIVSFEPCAIAYKRLQEAARADASWVLAPRGAIGDREGHIRLNRTSNGGQSSSVLPMLETHRRAAPDASPAGSEIVPISRLDHAVNGLLAGARRIFLKIDVQGYEAQVLRGAGDVLARIVGAQIELSLVPLYDGQALFPELFDLMRGSGFTIWGLVPGLVDNSSGRLLQTDVVFFRD
jgi:FkbM family methyltransferase